jgi:hypothetical protein
MRLTEFIRLLEQHRDQYGDALIQAETERLVCPVIGLDHDVFDSEEGNVCLLQLDTEE